MGSSPLSKPQPRRYIDVFLFVHPEDGSMTRRSNPCWPAAAALLLPLAMVACGGGDDRATGEPQSSVASIRAGADTPTPLVDLLRAGEVVFGIFSGEHTPEGGRLMAQNRDADFVFYSLESGPFDLDAMEAYIDALSEAAGGEAPPIALRIPPIRDDRQAAVDRTRRGLASGATSIVYPHVESVEDVRLAAEAVGNRLWPVAPQGDLLNVLLLEDVIAIERAREIVSAPGAGVVIPGPGDLRRAYEGDMVAVEGAIQTVLAACLEFDVPCGITAGVDDIASRIDQGFRFFIVTQPEAIAIGRAAAGRGN